MFYLSMYINGSDSIKPAKSKDSNASLRSNINPVVLHVNTKILKLGSNILTLFDKILLPFKESRFSKIKIYLLVVPNMNLCLSILLKKQKVCQVREIPLNFNRLYLSSRMQAVFLETTCLRFKYLNCRVQQGLILFLFNLINPFLKVP